MYWIHELPRSQQPQCDRRLRRTTAEAPSDARCRAGVKLPHPANAVTAPNPRNLKSYQASLLWLAHRVPHSTQSCSVCLYVPLVPGMLLQELRSICQNTPRTTTCRVIIAETLAHDRICAAGHGTGLSMSRLGEACCFKKCAQSY